MIKNYKIQDKKINLKYNYTENNHFQIGFDACAFQHHGEIFFTNYVQSSRATSNFFILITKILSKLNNSKIVYTGSALNSTLIKIIIENKFNIEIIHINMPGITPPCPVSPNRIVNITNEYLIKIIDLFHNVKTYDIIFKLVPLYLGFENLILDELPLEIYRFLPNSYNNFQPSNWSILEKKSRWIPFLWCLENEIPCYPSIFRFNPEIIQSSLETLNWNNFQQNFIDKCEKFSGSNIPYWINNIKRSNEYHIEDEFWTIPLFKLHSILHNQNLDKTEYFFGF